MDIQDREEAVAILTREDSTNVSLLLARPEIEVRKLDMGSLRGELGLNADLKKKKNCILLPLSPSLCSKKLVYMLGCVDVLS